VAEPPRGPPGGRRVVVLGGPLGYPLPISGAFPGCCCVRAEPSEEGGGFWEAASRSPNESKLFSGMTRTRTVESNRDDEKVQKLS